MFAELRSFPTFISTFVLFFNKFSYIIEICKIKHFICDPVLVTKKLRPLQAKIKYQNNNIDILFLFEEVAIFLSPKPGRK